MGDYLIITVYVDGLCEPVNPGGVATWGFCVYEDGRRLFQKWGVASEGEGISNNLAEYSALCEALKELLKLGWQNRQITVRSDSKPLVNQMSGKWECRGGFYAEKYREAVNLASKFPSVFFEWIPREQNEEADMLSHKAYVEYCGKSYKA